MRVYETHKWPLMQDTMSWGDRLKLATHVLTADRFTQGKKVEEFEAAWSKWLGAEHSLFVSSGSTANFLLLDAIKDLCFKGKKKIKVLLPACTWVTNINPVMQLGMTPIFCDVNLYNYSFDEDNVKAIAAKHDIDIVFTTHLLGLPADSEDLRDLFPNAVFLDDMCESHGARDFYGAKIGSQSTGATFSFYYGHHMSTIEGGMISTNNFRLYNIMRMKRSHGMSRAASNPDQIAAIYPEFDPQFLFVKRGYNFRNTELAAVLGLSQLKRLDGFIEQRQKNYRRYMEIMKVYGADKFYLPGEGYAEDGNSSFCFPFIARSTLIRGMLLSRLKMNQIEYRPVVGGNLLRHPYMRGHKIACNKGPYNADIIHDNGIYIGNNQFVGNKELNLLETIIKEM